MIRAYFCFDYGRDLHRVSQIQPLPGITAKAAGGFKTASIWTGAREAGEAQLQGLVNDGLVNSTVSVICIGQRSAYSKILPYEIERSLEKGNALLGIVINHLKDEDGGVDAEAPVPKGIHEAGYKVYRFKDKATLAQMIEEAAQIRERLQAGAAGAAGSEGGPPAGVPERRHEARRQSRGRRSDD